MIGAEAGVVYSEDGGRGYRTGLQIASRCWKKQGNQFSPKASKTALLKCLNYDFTLKNNLKILTSREKINLYCLKPISL